MPIMPLETRGPSILAQIADTFVEGDARNQDAIRKVLYANKQSRTMADIAGGYREGIANAKTMNDVLKVGSGTLAQLSQVDSPHADKFAQHITQDMGIRARMMGTTPHTFDEALLSGKIDEPTYKRYSEMKPSNATLIYDKDGNLISAPKNNIPVGAKPISTVNLGISQGGQNTRQEKAQTEAEKKQQLELKEAEQKEDRKRIEGYEDELRKADVDIEETRAVNKNGTFTNLLNTYEKNKAAIQNRIKQILKKNKWDAGGDPLGGEETNNSFEVGQLYQDASGNKAKYLGNGKWENVK